MADSTIVFLILAAAVVAFISNRLPVAVVAVGVAISLWATGLLTLQEALAGFGDPTVLFIAALFIVADSLESTGVTTWISHQLLVRSGDGGSRIAVMLMATCALLTALITPNASVAALIPAAALIALRTRQPASHLMMPLAFAAHGGALLALTGSPVNVLVAEAAAESGTGHFGFMSFALVGVPLTIGIIAISALIGSKVLPARTGRSAPADFGALAAIYADSYDLDEDPKDLFTRTKGVAELIIPPRSPLIDEEFFSGMVTESGKFVVLGIQRQGDDLDPGVVRLRAGDTILVRGTWDALATRLPDDPDVLTIEEPDAVRRQVVKLGNGAKESLAVLGVMVIALATGAVPPAIAALLAAGALILLRVTTVELAYRSISWTTVILVAGMIPMSTAMQKTGAAELLANQLVGAVGGHSPYILLIGLFVMVAVMGQLISNTATALIVIPIGISAAAELGVSAMPVLMAINVAAAGALLTPVATPANMMVMEPGGYRFGDYWKLGLPLMGWFFIVSVFITPLIWRF